jgi:hypothetical protein
MRRTPEGTGARAELKSDQRRFIAYPKRVAQGPYAARSARRQRLARHLHAAGARPILEALIAVEQGQSLDAVLADFARVPIEVYHALGADRLPLLTVTNEGRDD